MSRIFRTLVIALVALGLAAQIASASSLILDVPGTLGFCVEWGCSGTTSSGGIVVRADGTVQYAPTGSGSLFALAPGPNGELGWSNGSQSFILSANGNFTVDNSPNAFINYAVSGSSSFNLPLYFDGYTQAGDYVGGAQGSLDGTSSYAAICPKGGGVCEYLPQLSNLSALFFITADMQLAFGMDGVGTYWTGGPGNWTRNAVDGTAALTSGSTTGHYAGQATNGSGIIGIGNTFMPTCSYLGAGCTGNGPTRISGNGGLIGNQQSIGVFQGPGYPQDNANVPEPASVLLTAGGILELIRRKRRKAF